MLRDWKNEFITETGDLVRDGINKWIGLRKENLTKHGCLMSEYRKFIWADDASFSTNSCTLCDAFHVSCCDEPCLACPLYKFLGFACSEDDTETPWTIFITTGDVEPMITALKGALDEH